MPPFKDRRPPLKYRNVFRHVREDHGWLFPETEDHEELHKQMHKENPMNPPYGFGPPGHHHGDS